MISHDAKYKVPDRGVSSRAGAADWSASLQKPPDTVTWIQQRGKKGRRKVGEKTHCEHSLLLWAHLLVEQMQLVLKEKQGEVTSSIGHILANTIDLSVMGPVRAGHALFSQKAVSTRRGRSSRRAVGTEIKHIISVMRRRRAQSGLKCDEWTTIRTEVTVMSQHWKTSHIAAK